MTGIGDVGSLPIQLIDQIFGSELFSRKLTNVLAKQFGTRPNRLFRLLEGNPIAIIDLGIGMNIESERAIIATLHA